MDAVFLAPIAAMVSPAVYVIPIAALMIPMIVVPTALVIKHLRRKREMLHRERMKALEMGLPISETNAWPAAVAAIGIGAGVPIGCFLVIWLATLTAHVGDEAFIGAMVVGIVAIIQGSRLAMRLADVASYPLETRSAHVNGKPAGLDPDAYDVVGRRG